MVFTARKSPTTFSFNKMKRSKTVGWYHACSYKINMPGHMYQSAKLYLRIND